MRILSQARSVSVFESCSAPAKPPIRFLPAKLGAQMIHPSHRYVLVADIGGTNTRVALAQGSNLLPQTLKRFSNANFEKLETVLSEFLKDHKNTPLWAAAVAAAGPVVNGAATMTNLNWQIREDRIRQATGAEHVIVMNDLMAQGYALGCIDANKLCPVIQTVADPKATKLVLGIGTGFNAAPVYEENGLRLVAPAEAGHASLPIYTQDDLRLAEHLTKTHGFAAVEEVLSGRGLEALYAWVGQGTSTKREATAAEIIAALDAGKDPLANDAARLFVRFLGMVAGDLSLTTLPYGGLYLAGGVARAIAPWLIPFGFVKAFHNKGRFTGFMKNFAVMVLNDDYAALEGLAHYVSSNVISS